MRQELLEALGKESGLDIPISNAIPSGTVSDAKMAKILTYSLYHRDRDCIGTSRLRDLLAISL